MRILKYLILCLFVSFWAFAISGTIQAHTSRTIPVEHHPIIEEPIEIQTPAARVADVPEVHYVSFTDEFAVDPIIKNLKKNWLDKFSVQIPLDYTRSFGPADLTIGASAEFNLPGYCRLQGDSPAEVDKYNYKYKGIKLTPFTANVHVSFTIYNVGVYAKYSPMKVMSEAQGPEFTTWTVGLFFK